MLVCDRCGAPLGKEIEDDPPEFCPDCSRRYTQTPVQKWVDYDERQARIDEARAKTAPKAKLLPEGVGGIAFIGDELRGQKMDYSIGKIPTSKSQRKKDYEAAGMFMVSGDEMIRRNGRPMAKPGVAMSYAGQKRHKSTAERGGPVRTATGQEIQ